MDLIYVNDSPIILASKRFNNIDYVTDASGKIYTFDGTDFVLVHTWAGHIIRSFFENQGKLYGVGHDVFDKLIKLENGVWSEVNIPLTRRITYPIEFNGKVNFIINESVAGEYNTAMYEYNNEVLTLVKRFYDRHINGVCIYNDKLHYLYTIYRGCGIINFDVNYTETNILALGNNDSYDDVGSLFVAFNQLQFLGMTRTTVYSFSQALSIKELQYEIIGNIGFNGKVYSLSDNYTEIITFDQAFNKTSEYIAGAGKTISTLFSFESNILYVNIAQGDMSLDTPMKLYKFVIAEDPVEPGETVYPCKLSRNPIVVQANTEHGALDSFKFELFVKENTELIVTLDGSPDQDGVMLFQVEQLLDKVLSYDLPDPAQIKACPNLLKEFTFLKKETYGDVATVIESEEKFYVQKGGLSYLDFPGNTFFTSNRKKFLTWQPDKKFVSPEQPEWLFYNTLNNDFDNLYRHCKIYYTDGSYSFATPELKGSAQNKILSIPVGLINMANLDAGKMVYKYTVWVSKSDDPNSDTGKSEERTFVIDYDYYENDRLFIFQNSLGAFETIRCVGRAEQSIEVSSQTGAGSVPANYIGQTPKYLNINSSYRDIMKVSTGNMNKVWRNHFAHEFLFSENRFEFINGKFVPIVLATDKIIFNKDSEYLTGLTFEYMYAFDNYAYSII
jgi:hypothetical protein